MLFSKISFHIYPTRRNHILVPNIGSDLFFLFFYTSQLTCLFKQRLMLASFMLISSIKPNIRGETKTQVLKTYLIDLMF